jgi:hypothetical protein
MRNNLKQWQKWRSLFYNPKAEQKNNSAVDSVYINEISDDFYEITVDLSHYGADFKPVPIAFIIKINWSQNGG